MGRTLLAALCGAGLLLAALQPCLAAGRVRTRRQAALALAALAAGVALAGGMALARLPGFRWPSVAAAVLLAPLLAALVRAAHPVLRRLLPWGGLGAAAVLPLLLGSGAVFLLPLWDPVLSGQRPVPWHVLLTAEPLAILVIVWDVGVSLSWGDGWRGLLALLGGAVAGGALLAIGVLFTLVAALGAEELLAPGIWMGAVGFLIAASGGAFWALTGMAWLPPVVRPAGGWPRPRPARAGPPRRLPRTPGWMGARRSTTS